MKTNNTLNYILSLLKRLASSVAVLTVLLFFNGPMALILANKNQARNIETFMYCSYLNKFLVYAAAFILPLIFATTVYDYMFNERIADFNLSLPVKRRTQLLSGFIASTVSTIIPIAINLLITVGLYATAIPLPTVYLDNVEMKVGISYIFLEIFIMFLIIVTVSAVCGFVAVFVGTKLEHFVYSCGIIFMPLIISALLAGITNIFLYGFDTFSPFTKIANISPLASASNFAFIYQRNSIFGELSTTVLSSSVNRIVVSLILCLILFAISFWKTEKRKGEYSGRKGIISVLSIVINIVVSFSLGFLVSLFFSSIMEIKTPGIGFCLMTAFFSLIAYIVINFILTQSLKNFKRNIPFLLITVSLSILMFIFDVTGGFGIERKLPNADDIEYATVDYSGFDCNYSYYELNSFTHKNDIQPKISSKETLNNLLSLHKETLNNRDELFSPDNYYQTSRISVQYTLKNGKSIQRYFQPLQKDRDDFLKNLHNDKAFNESAFAVFYIEPKHFDSISISNYKTYASDKTLKISIAQKQQLIDAMRADIDSTINSKTIDEKGAVIGEICFNKSEYDNIHDYTREYNVRCALRKNYTKTIELLKQFGYKFPEDGEASVSHLEIEYDSDPDVINLDYSSMSSTYKSLNIIKENITPELINDILSKSIPEGSLIGTLESPSRVCIYDNDSDNNKLYYIIYLERNDLTDILEKHNIDKD